MSGRLNYYYRQKVTEAELDQGFALLETADRALSVDLVLAGVVSGLAVTQHATPQNLTVDITAGVAYDKLGERVNVGAPQTVNCAIDEGSVSTAVAGGGNSKILSVFAKFTRNLSDPRLDGNAVTVYFSEAESFQFVVRQGAEGVSPAAPALDSTLILLADITITFGQTQIINSNISTARREDLIVVSSSPRSLRGNNIKSTFSSLLGFYNNHVTAVADRHSATAIDGTATGNWADATNVAAGTVQAMLAEIVSDLAATTGDVKVGTPGRAGTPVALGSGTIGSQIVALLAAINSIYAFFGTYAFYTIDTTTTTNGNVFPVTVSSESGGFTEGATDEIQVPAAGTYLVTADATLTSTTATADIPAGFNVQVAGANAAGGNASTTRYGTDNTKTVRVTTTIVAVIATPASQRIRLLNNNAAPMSVASISGGISITRIK